MTWLRRRFVRPTLAVGMGSVLLCAWLALHARRHAESLRPIQPVAGVAGPRVAIGPTRQQNMAATAVRHSRPDTPSRAPVEESEPLPQSLDGTDADGWLGVDEAGHLVVTPGARWFFDYFLSATGEESPEQIRARIVAALAQRLPAAGAQEALDLLDRYLAYRDRVRTLQDTGAPADAEQRLAQLHDIRRETFGDATAAALFGEEEQMQAADIDRRRLLTDRTLPPDERERRLEALDAQLPPAVRQARSEATTLIGLQADEQQLRQAGGSAEDIHALREQRFGADAADRLDALDRERAAWEQRLDDYRSARQAIEDDATLTSDARARAVEALRAERFTPEEQPRVAALDTVHVASH